VALRAAPSANKGDAAAADAAGSSGAAREVDASSSNSSSTNNLAAQQLHTPAVEVLDLLPSVSPHQDWAWKVRVR